MKQARIAAVTALTIGLVAGSMLPVTAQDAESSTISEEEALAVNEAWFAAYDEGDLAGMLTLIAPDATLAETFGSMGRDAWSDFYTWKIAEGTQFVDRDCAAEANDDSTEVTVDCTYAHLPYSHRLVGAPAVPHTQTQVIGPDGIRSQRQRFGSPDFSIVDRPWERWLAANDPELLPMLDLFTWSTPREAELMGRMWAASAEEWAAWLDENGCAYDEPCPRPVTEPVTFTGYVPFGPALVAQTTTRERGLEQSRGGSWKTRSSANA